MMQVRNRNAYGCPNEIVKYEKIFLGDCHGVILTRRGKDDPHVCMNIITEDDGNWHISDTGCSAFWLPKLISVLQEAQDWMEKNCDPDKCGWKFR